MAASTSNLADKLHEYPQQDVIDGAGDVGKEILDDCLNKNEVLVRSSYGHFYGPLNL